MMPHIFPRVIFYQDPSMGTIGSHLLFICGWFSECSLCIWDGGSLQKEVGKYFLSTWFLRLFHVVSHRVRLLNFYFKDKRDSKHQAFPFMGLAFGDKSRNSFLGLSSQRVSHIYSLLSFSFYIPSWVNFYLRGKTEAGVRFPVYIGSTFQSHLLKTVLFRRVVSRPLPEITWAHL